MPVMETVVGAGGAVTFRERIRIGSTAMTAQEVQDTVNEMGGAFRGNSYHLLQKCAATFLLLPCTHAVAALMCIDRRPGCRVR